MYNDIINEICLKYNYSKELRKAISVVFPLMVEEYNDLEGVKKLFLDVRIFCVQNIDDKTINDINLEMLSEVNEHIILDESNVYDNNSVGAFYSYEPVFDNSMNVVDEIKLIVIKGFQDKYQSLFRTSVDIPSFLHELNHAYGMQNPVYRISGNQIYSKHGMYETVSLVESMDSKYIVRTVKQDNIMSEEVYNEFITRRMLCGFFGVTDYSIVSQKLDNIGHVRSVYTNLHIEIARYLESAIGKDNLMRYRKDNDYSVIDKFNELSMETELHSSYFNDSNPFSYLNSKIFEMFNLSSNYINYLSEDKKEEYRIEMLRLFYDAVAPIYSYNIVLNNKGSVGDYMRARRNELGEEFNNGNLKK